MCHSGHINRILSARKGDLISIYKHALDSIRPERLVSDAVHIDVRTQTLMLKSYDDMGHGSQQPTVVSLRNRSLHVIGGGKCVLAMARGLATKFQEYHFDRNLFSRGHICVPGDLRAQLNVCSRSKELLNYLNVECLYASNNNLPDDDSVRATQTLLEGVTNAFDEPVFIVLISGGGSSCLCSPEKVDLQGKLEIIRHLVQKGADIVELNQVRRYFSSIKGGGLLRHIYKHHKNALVITLIISDVIGDKIEFIASGPTHISNLKSEPDHKESMMRVLNKYQLAHLCPANLCSTKVDQSIELAEGYNVANLIIGNNRIALREAKVKAQELGYCGLELSHEITGRTAEVVRRMIEFAYSNYDRFNIRPILVLAGGETTVERKLNEEWGRGGRVQEMALDYMIEKNNVQLHTTSSIHPNDLFLAGTTDGQDGPTDVAACLASHTEPLFNNMSAITRDQFVRAKRMHDSYNFWLSTKSDWLIKTGLTNSNVMDLYMLMLFPPAVQP